MEAARAFIRPCAVDLEAIMEVKAFERLRVISAAVEALVGPDDRRREFLRLAGGVTKAYKALLPDERAAPFLKPVAVIHTLADAVRAKLGPVDISAISGKIAQIIEEKLEGVAILTPLVEGDTAKGRWTCPTSTSRRWPGCSMSAPRLPPRGYGRRRKTGLAEWPRRTRHAST
ncbi:type I restriction enzyme endonuclease domain-containing protein [Novosphingobium panipatense]